MFVTDKAVTARKPSLRVRIAQGGAERLRRHWDEPLDLPDPETVSVKLKRRPLVHADTGDLRDIRCDHVSAAATAYPCAGLEPDLPDAPIRQTPISQPAPDAPPTH